VIFAALAMLATMNLPAIWQGRASAVDRWPEWWVRGLPTAIVVGWAMLAGVPLAVVGPHQHGTAKTMVLLALSLVLVVILVAVLVWVMAACFGRPRWVVPPPLRRRNPN
jgi:hypothetical protein